ncbi:MAG: alpha/beta hydrolase [Nitrospinaceae bacterium]|jgi:esterase FrsA|nr:alpha/beta hydrolase [Nitrospinaceae bacterium]MBT3432342.1 alpha/beta hydrolase [Nitrospinaceae bacterium]MBT4092872.1 alpha/beta hydrolase [Nitrospinaceae bacterium]MBT4429234.1 alpha/beta hydrolase [Nitrospinaceae bacterium]MBT5368901.1 alpha/beta hydrolase [Nitrospinaceae bacterium]
MTDTSILDSLPVAPSEDPFVVEHGGFYRRWFSMIDDIQLLKDTVASLKGTTDNLWVPVWRDIGRKFETEAEALAAKGDGSAARAKFLQAKSYYSLARFPRPLTPLKEEVNQDCIRVYLRAAEYLDPPLEKVAVECEGKSIISHFRAPAGAGPGSPVPAVLIMCGGDMFKEDRGWAGEMAMDNGLATLVMDGPGTGENPFPYEPESVTAWMAAIDYLAARPEVDERRIGAFGISRGGHSVMLLAGSYPEKVGCAVASAGHPYGYQMSDDEMANFVENKNRRASYVFGAPGDAPSFPPTTLEAEKAGFKRWALSEIGVVDKITCPILMINGKQDHLSPIGNIYYMLERGPVLGREARIYPDDGHCAFKYFSEWAPESFRWIKEKLERAG